jgi:tetratricopeptide (TPR) repeat protein
METFSIFSSFFTQPLSSIESPTSYSLIMAICTTSILFILFRYELWASILPWWYKIISTKTTTTKVKSPPNPKIRYVHNYKIAVSGISLKYLIELVRKFSRYRFRNPTMYDLVDQWIKPKTLINNESYLEFLGREQPNVISTTAEYFVSYVWGYSLKELVAALEYELLTKQNKQDVFIWIDSVCLNQHIDEKIPPVQLQDTFGESLKTIGSVVMVLSNWRNPSYAKRSWCVFEAYMTKKIPNVKVILAMSQQEEKSLMDAMIGNQISVQFLQQYFSSVDVESAKAKESADQQAILQLIREFDVADVNAVILGNLKQWMVQVGEVALKNVGENSKEADNICNVLLMAHSVLGEFDRALEWAEKSLNISIKFHGPEHEEVATAYNNKAALLKDLERLDEALVANERDWAICSKILGADHPNTFRSRSWKAGILQAQGKLEDALVIRDEVLQSRRRVLGEDHPDTVLAIAYKANCLSDLKQYNEALTLYEEILVISKRNLGENHPNTAAYINNKAQCLQQMGRPEDALPLYDQSIANCKKVNGEVHPHMATAIGSKALCLKKLGRFKDALPLFDQALAIFIKVYGENHSTVATILNNKAFCLKSLGRIDEAKQLGKQALQIAECVFGASHPITIDFRENWGS